MKFFLMLALSAVSVASLFAASIPRTDIDATKAKVKLTPGKVEGGFKTSNQGWGDEATRPFRLVSSATKPVGTEWTVCELVFTPESDGMVTLGIGGQWAKEAADRGWVAVSGLEINGEAVSNSDLTKSEKKGDKDVPAGYWTSSKAAYVADGGPNGAGAVIVNHDNRLYRNIQVKGGKPVTVKYKAKAAEAQK
jgi:hypothetical protein